jgi:four helix bundle protein
MGIGKRASRKPVLFTDLETWQEGHKLVVQTYKLLPGNDSLSTQMQRAAVSVTSNIAEGFGRQLLKDKTHFYVMARGSLTELQNQIVIARDIGRLTKTDSDKISEQSTRVLMLIHGLIRSLNKKKPG